MSIRITQLCRTTLTAGALGACLFAPTVLAAVPADATANSSTNIEARYKTDVARCKAGQTNQDEATCLQEAGAALEEAKRNQLNNHQAGSYDQNTVDRCNGLPLDKQKDCIALMSGKNEVKEGSIDSGGVLRETTIPVPAKPEESTIPTVPTTPVSPTPSVQ